MTKCKEVYQLFEHCISENQEILAPPCLQIVCEPDSEDGLSQGTWILIASLLTVFGIGLFCTGFYFFKKYFGQRLRMACGFFLIGSLQPAPYSIHDVENPPNIYPNLPSTNLESPE